MCDLALKAVKKKKKKQPTLGEGKKPQQPATAYFRSSLAVYSASTVLLLALCV